MSIKSPHRFLARVAATHPVRFSHFYVGIAGMTAAGLLATCAVAAAPRPGKIAAAAQAALTKGKIDKAIALAEQAVSIDPRNAAWRVVLGDAYLRAGRFVSAGQAYDEALKLGNDKGRTALALALMQISQGQYAQASDTLSAYRDSIPASDYGLALALSGQTGQGVAVLADALRQGDNSPKIRQNLAYAFALDGKWPMARAMVEQDLPADKVDDRLSQWALADRPEDTQKRVAMLLEAPLRGDPGEPVQLALAATPNGKAAPAHAAAEAPAAAPRLASAAAPRLASAAAAELPPLPAEPSAPAVDVSDRAAVSATAAAAPALIDGIADVPVVLQNVRAETAPVTEPALAVKAQPAPAPRVRLPVVRQPVAQQTVAPAPFVRRTQVVRAVAAPVYPSIGSLSVQLGAFATQDGAKRALRHYSTRHRALNGHQLTMVRVHVANKVYWRVLATGFAGHSASAACHAVTAGGGVCLVRADMSRFQHAQPVRYAHHATKPALHAVVAPGLARRK